MSQVLELFHGAPAAAILSIMNSGAMRPDAVHQIFFSERFEDALQHGADIEKQASFAFKARVTIVDGASVNRTAKPGNPFTVLVTTTLPLPTEIFELYVRTGRAGDFQGEKITGAGAIKARLLRPAS